MLFNLIPVAYLQLAFVLGLLAAAIFDSYTIVPTGSVGAPLFLKRRLRWRSFKEGFHLKPPFVRMKFISLGLLKAETNFQFLALAEKEETELPAPKGKGKRPGFEVIVSGELNYIPDAGVFEETTMGKNVSRGQVLFLRTGLNLDTLVSGVITSVKAEIGKLGGDYTATSFTSNRRAISDIINCFLRLSIPPHVSHDNTKCKVADCPGKIPSGQTIFEFYSTHSEFVNSILDEERFRSSERSPIEIRYGVDIIIYNLYNVDLTEDAKQAYEEQQETEALEWTFQERVRLAKFAQENIKGLKGQEAVNWVETNLNEENATRQVISIEGQGGAVPLLPVQPKEKKGKR